MEGPRHLGPIDVPLRFDRVRASQPYRAATIGGSGRLGPATYDEETHRIRDATLCGIEWSGTSTSALIAGGPIEHVPLSGPTHFFSHPPMRYRPTPTDPPLAISARVSMEPEPSEAPGKRRLHLELTSLHRLHQLPWRNVIQIPLRGSQ
jgi:hypothetical protein